MISGQHTVRTLTPRHWAGLLQRPPEGRHARGRALRPLRLPGVGGLRLFPRNSFALWSVCVRGRGGRGPAPLLRAQHSGVARVTSLTRQVTDHSPASHSCTLTPARMARVRAHTQMLHRPGEPGDTTGHATHTVTHTNAGLTASKQQPDVM